MNRFGIVLMGTLLVATLCYGQGVSSVPAQATPVAVAHGAFPVKVVKTLDSSKLKEGDAVEVETAGSFKLADGTLVPKGSKLTGHVTASKARSKGDTESQLTVTFDKLNVAGGKQLSIKGMAQAVFPPAEEAAPLMAGKASGAAGGGYGGDNVGVAPDSKSGSNLELSSKLDPSVDPKSVGAHGVRELSLEDGVLRSTGKQVKLGNGVRMIVHVDIFE
jgi:hypothetical protein